MPAQFNRPLAKWQHQLFTSNGTWVVPDGVNLVWIDMVGGGDGGAGGYASATSGGGGAGGTGMIAFIHYRFPVVAGETLTVVVGGGGAGGTAGNRGGVGGESSVYGSIHRAKIAGSSSSGPGPSPGLVSASIAGGSIQAAYMPPYAGEISTSTYYRHGGYGGAPSSGGEGVGIGNVNGYGNIYVTGGSAVGSLGGGGAGGSNPFGVGGNGGNGGQNGQDAPTIFNGKPSYGGSGGGGGANAAGGNGAPGFVRIYWHI